MKVFPIILMVLNICASAVYFANGDFRHGLYWASAFVLTATVSL
jgi:hypothetical protein